MQVVATPFDFGEKLTGVGGSLGLLGEHTAQMLAAAGVEPVAVQRIVAAAAKL